MSAATAIPGGVRSTVGRCDPASRSRRTASQVRTNRLLGVMDNRLGLTHGPLAAMARSTLRLREPSYRQGAPTRQGGFRDRRPRSRYTVHRAAVACSLRSQFRSPPGGNEASAEIVGNFYSPTTQRLLTPRTRFGTRTRPTIISGTGVMGSSMPASVRLHAKRGKRDPHRRRDGPGLRLRLPASVGVNVDSSTSAVRGRGQSHVQLSSLHSPRTKRYVCARSPFNVATTTTPEGV